MHHILKYIFLSLFIFVLSLAGAVLMHSVYAWTGAPGQPAVSNTPAPINVSSLNQTKSGSLTLGKDLNLYNSASSVPAGIKIFPDSTSANPLYGYVVNDFNTLRYKIQANPTDKTLFSIGSDGNVAIGDIVPQAKLHVDGNIIANGIIMQNGNQTFLTSESDPTIQKPLSPNLYCRSNAGGTQVVCDASASALDSRIGTLTGGSWCTSNGTQINCQANQPVLSEVDPKIGTLTNGKWCTTNGSKINCASNTPSDIVSKAPNSWCGTDGNNNVTCDKTTSAVLGPATNYNFGGAGQSTASHNICVVIGSYAYGGGAIYIHSGAPNASGKRVYTTTSTCNSSCNLQVECYDFQ